MAGAGARRAAPGAIAHRLYPYDRIGWGLTFGRTRSPLVPTRFYCPSPPSDGVYRLSAHEAKHLGRVCRLGAGDEVEIFDGRGFATCARVIALGNDWVDLTVLGEPMPEQAPPFALVLASAAPKADRLDWLVEKATELGVARWIPIISDRSVVEPGSGKLARLERTVVEASKQCGRARLMAIDPPARWSSVVGAFDGSQRYLADAQGIRPSRIDRIPAGQDVVLAVGPEGGFTPQEREQAAGAGWQAICLGVNTLRIETAAVAGIAGLFSRAEEPHE
jgi:16S rRNA (uracil1498-N3)-methyltransferase